MEEGGLVCCPSLRFGAVGGKAESVELLVDDVGSSGAVSGGHEHHDVVQVGEHLGSGVELLQPEVDAVQSAGDADGEERRGERAALVDPHGGSDWQCLVFFCPEEVRGLFAEPGLSCAEQRGRGPGPNGGDDLGSRQRVESVGRVESQEHEVSVGRRQGGDCLVDVLTACLLSDGVLVRTACCFDFL